MEEIEIHAIYTKGGAVILRDQDGRKFAARPPHQSRDKNTQVLVNVELELPHWPFDIPRANITISVPLEVEERVPDYLLRERI